MLNTETKKTQVLTPELSARVLAVLGRLIDADGLAFTSDTQAAGALSRAGWVVGLALEVDSPTPVWRIRSAARALADARALLDEVSA
jgi:hypothetical protein